MSRRSFSLESWSHASGTDRDTGSVPLRSGFEQDFDAQVRKRGGELRLGQADLYLDDARVRIGDRVRAEHVLLAHLQTDSFYYSLEIARQGSKPRRRP